MEIRRSTQSYNERRYGRPWIAKVVITPAKPKGEFLWGTWIGDSRNGSEGELILNSINSGDIYARGQKDNRQPKNSAPNYYVLDHNGKGITCKSLVDAIRTAKDFATTNPTQPVEMADDDLLVCTA